MLTHINFRAPHVDEMAIQADQAWLMDHYSLDDLKVLEGRYAATVLKDGVPVMCTGAAELSPARCSVWAILSARIDAALFREIHPLAKTFLGVLPYRRVEAVVDVDFRAGHRWVRALGFEQEAARMRGYELDGRDCALYAKVR